MKCDELDYFDDMYPEFAPDPIVVSCDEAAVTKLEISSPAVNAEGFEIRGVYERHLRFLCRNHYKMLKAELDSPHFPWEAKVIRETHGGI
jgi:hypothetical protein